MEGLVREFKCAQKSSTEPKLLSGTVSRLKVGIIDPNRRLARRLLGDLHLILLLDLLAQPRLDNLEQRCGVAFRAQFHVKLMLFDAPLPPGYTRVMQVMDVRRPVIQTVKNVSRIHNGRATRLRLFAQPLE